MEKSILIIDDEQRLAESLRDLLREEGYDVDAAIGGAQGLEALQRRTYQLVITDLRMPEVDGFQIMNFVSKNMPGTAMIIITGHASTQSAIEAVHHRVADYLTKPFELDLLIASIEKVFARLEAEELRREMMRMISHDIKVPLNSILGFAQFLVDRNTGKISENAAEYADKIVVSGQRILALLDNYLTQARAETGRLDIMCQPMVLDGVVEDALRLLTPEFERRHITLSFEFSIRDLVVQADEALLFRAISNLISNAAKYTPENGWTTVTLGTRERDGLGTCAVIEVENSGPGIKPDELPTIFHKYRRASSSHGIEGTGLGLYVVSHVAKAHGGIAECESTPNERTIFRMLLPLEKLHAKQN